MRPSREYERQLTTPISDVLARKVDAKSCRTANAPVADITESWDAEGMALIARLKEGETLGDRIIKVDHAGEHGAVCVYRAQRWLARWRAPEMVPELDEFLAHERSHRAQFEAELRRRNKPRCRSYALCATGGFLLGILTGLAGRQAIAATTVAIERVVLRHMHEQVQALDTVDQQATDTLRRIIVEEQEHHDRSAARVGRQGLWSRLLDPLVTGSTEAVIWLGMRL